MALHNLKIIVVDGGRQSSFSTNSHEVEGQEVDNSSPLYKILHARETIKNKLKSNLSPGSAFALDMGLRVSGQVIKSGANYFISDIGRRNGDSNYQQNINRQIEIVSDVLSVGQGALSGAMAGSMAGPIGIAIGATFGVISSGINLAFKYSERERSYQHEMFQNNTNQAYNLARANYSAYTGRVR